MTASTSKRIERSADSCANTLARSSCGWTGRRPPASSANCSANGTVGPSSESRLESAEIRLAVLSPSFAIRRTRERRVARTADAAGLQAGLAQPRAAGMSFDPERVVGLAFGRGLRGRRFSRFDVVGPIGLRFVVLRPFVLPDGAGLGLRLLRLGLKPRLRSDLVAAALEDLEGHLELLRLKGPQVQFLRQVDEVPFFLRQVEGLPDQVVIVPFGRRLEGRITHPIDVAPDCTGLLQIDVRKHRADVGESQRVQGPRILHMLEDRGPDGLELAEVLGLASVGRPWGRPVPILDALDPRAGLDGAI